MTDQPPFIPRRDKDEAIIRRDEAMDRVAEGSPDYGTGGLVLIGTLPYGMRVIGEDIRIMCLASGLTYHHYNVHGTLIKTAVRQGLLVPTGLWKHMEVPGSHGRRSPIYWVRGPLTTEQQMDIVDRLLKFPGPLIGDAVKEIVRLRRQITEILAEMNDDGEEEYDD